MVTETPLYDPHMRYPSSQLGGTDGTSGTYNRNFPGFNQTHGPGYMTDMNYSSSGYDGVQPYPQEYSPDYNNSMHPPVPCVGVGVTGPVPGCESSMWLQHQQQYSSDSYYSPPNGNFHGNGSQQNCDYRATDGNTTVPGSLPSNYSAGTSPGTPGNMTTSVGNMSPSPPGMWNQPHTVPRAGFHSPDPRCMSAGGSSDALVIDNRPTNGKLRYTTIKCILQPIIHILVSKEGLYC